MAGTLASACQSPTLHKHSVCSSHIANANSPSSPIRLRFRVFPLQCSVLSLGSGNPRSVACSSSTLLYTVSVSSDVPTVSETKSAFLKAYKRPIPSIYNNFIQELIVQQHLMRYKRTYQYDAVFALGFVTVFDQLMDGYPSEEDREAIFKAYINALKEDPTQYSASSIFSSKREFGFGVYFCMLDIWMHYRSDAKMLEEWASSQDSTSIVNFHSRDGEVEAILKDISERAKEKKNFNYSRFFAIGLFRLLERSNATDPTVLEKLCAALNVSKPSVDRDLDTYRNILSKLVQSKELLKEYVEREKKKRAERESTEKSSEAVAKVEKISS